MVGDRLSFFVPGDPVAKGRARHARTTKGVRTYTPGKTVRWEDWIALNAEQTLASGFRIFEGAVALDIKVRIRRPTSRPKKYIHADKRPDLDNYVKAVLDGIQKAGVWKDDAQVVELIASKAYAVGDQRPGIKIQIRKVSG